MKPFGHPLRCRSGEFCVQEGLHAARKPVQQEEERVDLPSETPFYIAATGIGGRPQRSLKYGDTFLVMDNHGDIGAGGRPRRAVSQRHALSLAPRTAAQGMQPLLLGSNVRDDNTVLAVDLTNPDIYATDRYACRRTRCTSSERSFSGAERPISGSASATTAIGRSSCELSLRFDSDFADLFEVRGLQRARRGVAARKVIAADQVC